MLARIKDSATCQCGANHGGFVCDALSTADPTGTDRIRRSFAFALQIRWRKVMRMVREAVVTRDFFGIGTGDNVQVQVIGSAGGKLLAFQTWFDGTLSQVVLNDIAISDFVSSAYSRGLTRAERLWNVAPAGSQDNLDLLIASTRAELQGIIEAVSQRAVRAFAMGLSTRDRPVSVARKITDEVLKVGDVRSKSLAHYAAVRAHTEANLDALAHAGIRRVGLLPETQRIATARDSLTVVDGDKSGHEFHGNQWTKGASVTLRHEETGSVATLVNEEPGHVLLTSVETPEHNRGKGGATKLMKQVEEHLNQNNLTARLVALAIEEGTTTEGLARLYGRHGFVKTKNFEMVRAKKRVTDGDLQGHEFHGNQWSGGGSKKLSEKYEKNFGTRSPTDKVPQSDEELDAAWQRTFKHLDPDDVKRGITGGKEASVGLEFADGKVSVSAAFKNGSLMVRTIEGAYVKHDILEVPKKLQGTDFAKAVLKGQVDLYEKMGLKGVKLWANTTVGSYAWAKYGFVPDAESWQEVGDIATKRAKTLLKNNEITERQFDNVRKIIGSEDPKGIWKLSDMKDPVSRGGKKTTLGKALLISTEKSSVAWSGGLDLHDHEQMKRFRKYV